LKRQIQLGLRSSAILAPECFSASLQPWNNILAIAMSAHHAYHPGLEASGQALKYDYCKFRDVLNETAHDRCLSLLIFLLEPTQGAQEPYVHECIVQSVVIHQES
jgi:hypothetical protein